MEKYKLKNPYISIVIPLSGLFSVLCIYPYLKNAFWLLIIPITITFVGFFIVYRKITYRITINDSTIIISKLTIPWNKVKRIISYKQMIESGSGMKKANRLGIMYETDTKKIKTICITPKEIDKPIAIVNSIKKRMEITNIQ